MRALVLTLCSAAAVAAAFPPWRWWPLAWVGLAPFLLAIRTGRLRTALGLGWLWLVAFAAIGGTWFPRGVSTYYAQPWIVGVAAFVLVTGTMGAPYVMAFVGLDRLLGRRRRWSEPWLVAAAWVAMELARGRLFTGSPVFIGNPWGLIGYSQADLPLVMQIASVTGIYGVGFVLVATNAAAAAAWRDRRLAPAAFAAGVPAAVALAFGLLTLDGAPDVVAPTPVALVQANLSLGATWRPEFYGRNLDVYVDESRRTLDATPAALLFWPESALSFFLEDDEALRAAVVALLRAHDVQLVTGGPRVGARNPRETFANSVFVVDPDGRVAGRYDKEYLVPFAEYFPLGIDLVRRRFGRVREFSPGASPGPLATRAGRAGVVVCNEAMLPEVVGRRVAAGAEYLVNPTNDTWISDAQYAAQELDIVRVRAVEQRRWLVRASTAGPSAVIDPWGRVVAATAPLARASLRASIAPRTDRTPYGRFGDGFGVACVVAMVVAGWRRRHVG